MCKNNHLGLHYLGKNYCFLHVYMLLYKQHCLLCCLQRGGFRMVSANELLARAIEESKKLYSDEIFLLRDLFKGYEWNRISRSDRLLLGTLFLNYVHTHGTHLEAIEKTSSGQQKYKVNNI